MMRRMGWAAALVVACGCGGDAGGSGNVEAEVEAEAEVEVEVEVEVGVEVEIEVEAEVEVEVEVEAEVDAGPEPSAILDLVHAAPRAADLVLVRLEGAGLGESIAFEGLVQPPELWVDPEDGLDNRYPFIARLLADDGALLFQKTLREPIQMREFFAASGFADYNLFEVFPQLAQFAVSIPRLADARRITFARRENDGHETPLGAMDLADLPRLPSRTDLPVTRLHGASPSDRALDIVLVGDGYTAAELPQFRAQADAIAAGFLATEPFHSYADRINIHRVDVASAVSGASYDCAADHPIAGCLDGFKDTAFGSIYPLRLAQTIGLPFSFDYVLLQLDQWAVARAAAAAPFDTVIVLVNSEKFGAFGLWVTSINGPGPDSASGVVHEFGHAFGHLADEYRHAGDVCQSFDLTPDYPNLAPLAAAPDEVPWRAWLTPDVPLPTPANDPRYADAIGQFKGAGGGCDDRYKPSRACLMDSWGTPMCPVCFEQMIKRFYTTFDVLSPEGLALDGHTVTLSRVDTRPIVGTWSVDGVPAGDVNAPLVLPADPDQAHVYTVAATVREDTPDIRTDPASLDEHLTAHVRIAPTPPR